MLSLLARIVLGGETENCSAREEDNAYSSSICSSSISEDKDEVFLSDPMPDINFNKTKLALESIDFLTSSDQTDSGEDVKDDSALEGKTEEQDPVVIPSRDGCQRIVELIEYYLSDENLVKDMFLLKHVTKHPEGYVSLKLLTSYKKVKRLTKDWRVVAHSLKSSKTLELNSDETKARRRSPLPLELEKSTRHFRTLLATHIAQDIANMNQLAEFFGKFGDMISLQVHKPGGRILNEVRQADQLHEGIVHTICAVIEYEKVHCARQALKFVINNAEECKMKAMELPRKKQDCLLGLKNITDAESAYYSNSDLSESPSPMYHDRPTMLKWQAPSSSVPSTPSVSPLTKRRTAKVNNSSPESSPPSPCRHNQGLMSSYTSSEKIHPATSFIPYNHYPVLQRCEVPKSLPLPRRQLPRPIPESKTDRSRLKNRNLKKHSLDSTVIPMSPGLRRRAFANRNAAASLSSTSSSPHIRRRRGSTMLLPENVLRFPRGPDGTKGFAMNRFLIQAKA